MYKKYNKFNPPKINRQCLILGLTIGLLLGSIGIANAALTAVTAKTIQGTPPYFQRNGVPLKNISELLSIQIGSDIYVSDASGNMQKLGTTSTFTTPIELPSSAGTFDSVKLLVPADNTTVDLNTSLQQSDFFDADGDQTFSAAGYIKATWQDKDNNIISSSLSDDLDVCKSIYTLTLTGTYPRAMTAQGDPRINNYGMLTTVFKITAPTKAGKISTCYLKPAQVSPNAGPVSMWDNKKYAFLPQTDAPVNDKNFPTTGGDDLFFDLYYAGNTSSITWTNPPTVNTISAKVISDDGTYARVLLNGSRTAVPTGSSPWKAPFTIRGVDGEGNVLEYGFTLKSWWRSHWANRRTYANSLSYCATIGYRYPEIYEMGNGVPSGATWTVSIPSTLSTTFDRHIGASFFSEWGMPGFEYYIRLGIPEGTSWVWPKGYGYATKETVSATQAWQFWNSWGTGPMINTTNTGAYWYPLCVYP